MGFLHHANYFNYFEMGRTELFRAAGGDYREMEEGGLFFVVVNLQCKYRLPAHYDDVLTLKTSISRITAAKLEHDYELMRGTEKNRHCPQRARLCELDRPTCSHSENNTWH